tara:strand:+ start:6556 stop:8994 length:2439 start_codon:yes stop_codon:yes gene_type:complete
LKVIKFGGTSVATSSSLKKVFSIIENEKDSIFVVVSALGDITNILQEFLNSKGKNSTVFLKQIEERHLEIIHGLSKIENQSPLLSFLKQQLNELETILEAVSTIDEITKKTISKVLSFGEILSSKLIYEILKERGNDISYVDSRKIIFTKYHNDHEIIDEEKTGIAVSNNLDLIETKIILMPGFIATDSNSEISNLGRGGSDYTASIIANYTNSKVLEIWTDVSGVFSANPKIVKNSRPIESLSYKEAMELSFFGAKVIYFPTLQPLIEKNIPAYIKNTFDPNAIGTCISNSTKSEKENTVKGISHIENISLINFEGSGMVGVPGFSKRFFEALSRKEVNVIMITQASSEFSICIAINESDAKTAKDLIDKEFEYEISQNKINESQIENSLSNIAIVGDNMKSKKGVSGKLFSTLGNNNINIRAIAQGASERNISIIIDEKDNIKALNSLHEAFFENNCKNVHLFITGVGNVGSNLIKQIFDQKKSLEENLRLKLKVMGLSNSKKMILSDTEIDLNDWKSKLDSSDLSSNNDQFLNFSINQNLRNSLFIDNTANADVTINYNNYLKNGIGIVTCNKIACSDNLEKYLELKSLSRNHNSPFLYETNVGAALPIINTLNNLINSGDRIIKIEAILSGTLNFIFNNFNKENSFYEVVKKAVDLGYTEPDPKIDLCGIDVSRKILILARESGKKIEFSDVQNETFLPKESIESNSKEEFLKSLKDNNDHFNQILNKAIEKRSRLKYVACLENDTASVGLKAVKEDHPFYNLEGSDNITVFHTDRYKDSPLVVKGPGAGGEFTASGVFADIIKASEK